VLLAAAGGRAAPPAPPISIEELTATRSYTQGAPRAFAVTRDGRAVLFLRGPARGRVQELWAFDVASGATRRLATAESLLGGAAEALSPEERARRERLRLLDQGIASFVLADGGDLVLIPLSGKLHVLELATGRARPVAGAVAATDARFSPDGRYVSFVRGHDLHVADWRAGRAWPVTRGGTVALAHGEAEFVAQEEMDRYTGYWWSPDSTRLAYEEADSRGVERRAIPDAAAPFEAADAAPYPRAGTPNALVRLGVIGVRGGATRWVAWDGARYPYLATVRWDEEGPLSLVVQTRDQREELLLAVDPATGRTRTLLTERDPAWLNLHQSAPRWLEGARQFLWLSERDGELRLWLHDADGRPVRALDLGAAARLRDLLHVDARRGVAVVSGGARTTERHVYELPLAGGAARRLTAGAGVHTWHYGRSSGVHVAHVETLTARGPWEVRRADGARAGLIPSAAAPPPYVPRVELTRAGDFEAALVRPRDFAPARRYPVLLDVYGGPGAVTVEARMTLYLRPQWYADQGVIVVSVDGRGTPGRGRAWERAIQGNFADVPLADQITALTALGARYPELDLGRVAIYGWSFGGYLAALGALRRPDVFRVAVAGAPVVDWRDYDTHYTERYLGLPAAAPDAYRKSCVLTYLGAGAARPLLLIHGTADDNVTFASSLKLADALFKAGRAFDFLPLVGQTHLPATPELNARLHARVAAFLRAHLGAPR
jgi:dipeptidyl-peptidase-4